MVFRGKSQPVLSENRKSGEYLMIESFEISNFRCFADVKTTPLKRFNIVVGDSGTGKTTLMESLFLMGGATPEIYFRLRTWRGLSTTLSANTKDAYESIFRDLFCNFDQKKGAVLSCVDSIMGRRSVEIYYKNEDTFSLPLNVQVNAFQIDPIIFKWQIGGKIYESSLELREGAFKITGAAPVAPVAYYNPINSNGAQNATAFSSLSRKYQSAKLLKAVQGIFPQVEDITIEFVAGEASLHVAAGLSQRLPIADLSGGVNKFVSIALGILANPGGLILVDEIDGGFYFKHLAKVWSALVKLCDEEQVQLVASTHSAEFLKAVAPSLEDKAIAYQFQLMRLEKKEGKQPDIKRFPASLYHDAMRAEMEIRG